MADIVDRLNDRADNVISTSNSELFTEAAREIEHLRKVIKDNWCGDYWRAVDHRMASEVRAVLAGAQ
ncbi:hypothetical protein IB276_26345 [Ensifer sp. ENS04]|uniref:hypothetical protein n=1 Tax=Ensifer sp. ENS04 TaxID=2769281 RepID=UPI001782C50B|nr:hypothetical protein [Ensifer sp. ENS04]MBD9542970.1 hypothetical protein [Ensifer sp. ENS04]